MHGNLKCGVCLKEFRILSLFQKHIYSEHNGLARPFGYDQTFTPDEQRTAYLLCTKAKVTLRCKTPGCTKVFKNAHGLMYHLDVALCGKEQERDFVTCELCGKVLVPASLPSHMKAFHPVTPPPEENEEEVLPKKRAAAEKAQERVAEIAKEIKTPDKPKQEAHDDDYHFDGVDEDGEKIDGENEETFSDEKLYLEPEKIHISREQFAEWRDELATNGVVLCKNTGCTKMMDTIKTIRFHYFNCPASTHGGLFTCIICPFSCSNRARIAKHVEEHKNGYNGENLCDTEGSLKPTCSANKHRSRKLKQSQVVTQLAQSIRMGGFDKRMFDPELAIMFNLENYQSTLFSNWPSLKSNWSHLSESEREIHLPKTKESVRFKDSFTTAESDATGNDVELKNLKMFESCSLNVESKVSTCFTGGPVWACAWCPTLNTIPCQQYVAVYCHNDMDANYLISKSHRDPGLLQIWDAGMLENGNDVLPRLALGIATDFGPIWSLIWCASGCWEDPTLSQNELDRLPRLGLLAAACGDGNIRIYSVPHPSSLHFDNADLPIYSSMPVAVLPLSGFPATDLNLQCTALSWHQGKDHRYIIGGYTNGSIAAFDLNTQSVLLRSRITPRTEQLLPFKDFLGHQYIVTGLDFVHSRMFFVSVSWDRCLKFWDLHDTSLPRKTIRQNSFNGVKWPPNWCGYFSYADNCYNLPNNSLSYTEYLFNNEASINLSSHNSCIWDASTSYWLNCVVSCDAAGEVVIAVVGNLTHKQILQSVTNHRRLPLYRIECIPKAPAVVPDNFDKDSATMQIKVDDTDANVDSDSLQVSEKSEYGDTVTVIDIEKTIGSVIRPDNYTDASNTFQLNYQNASVWNLKSIPLSELQRIASSTTMERERIDHYPLTSVNRVSWNPNLGAHLWIATGEQSGMLRLIKVNSLDKICVEDVRVAMATGNLVGAFKQ